MDLDETRGYIEHRLTKVGWKGNPSFDPAAYEAIYRATGGIPRRINSVCDRLLLSGYLAAKQNFGRDDVEDVAREITEETFSTPVVDPTPARGAKKLAAVEPSSGATRAVPLIELGGEFDSAVAGEASRMLTGIQSRDLEERVSRLERQAATTLALLQKLLDGLRSGRSQRNGTS